MNQIHFETHQPTERKKRRRKRALNRELQRPENPSGLVFDVVDVFCLLLQLLLLLVYNILDVFPIGPTYLRWNEMDNHAAEVSNKLVFDGGLDAVPRLSACLDEANTDKQHA